MGSIALDLHQARDGGEQVARGESHRITCRIAQDDGQSIGEHGHRRGGRDTSWPWSRRGQHSLSTRPQGDQGRSIAWIVAFEESSDEDSIGTRPALDTPSGAERSLRAERGPAEERRLRDRRLALEQGTQAGLDARVSQSPQLSLLASRHLAAVDPVLAEALDEPIFGESSKSAERGDAEASENLRHLWTTKN